VQALQPQAKEVTMRKYVFPPRLRRVLALMLGAMLALAILLGTAFVLLEQHHDCAGEHCGICKAVTQTVAFFKAGIARMMPVPAAAACLFAVIPAFAMPQMLKLPVPSLVSLKVKLSD
jgi:hypothetical protein